MRLDIIAKHTSTFFMKQKCLILLISLLFVTCLFAQQKNMRYLIISKADTVGQMTILQRISGNDISYTVASTVTTKMLMTIKVNVREEANYHNKKLMASSSQRIINDKPQAGKQTKAYQNFYLITDDAKQDTLRETEINFDFSMLYFYEPTGIKNVYSNYYQTKLPIQHQEAHSYVINLPEGGANVYHYTNGICSRVDMRNPLFTAQMILTP